MDYKLGKKRLNAPKLDRGAIEIFADEVQEVALKKIGELRTKHDALEQERLDWKGRVDVMVQDGDLDQRSEFFWREYYNTVYSEIFYVRKWIGYWLQVFEVARGEQGENLTIDVEKAKEAQIVDLYPFELRGSGDRQVGLCPFHEEKSGSFVVYLDQNTFNCYGCGENGDVISFIMKLEGISFIEAVRRLS